MAITKDINRQDVLCAKVDIALADLATGVEKVAITMPYDAIVVGGCIVVTEVFNSSTSDLIEVGDTADPNRYLTDGDGQAAGYDVLVPTGLVSVGNDISVTWTSTGDAPTTGAFTLYVLYVIAGRGESTYG